MKKLLIQILDTPHTRTHFKEIPNEPVIVFAKQWDFIGNTYYKVALKNNPELPWREDTTSIFTVHARTATIIMEKS